MLDAYFSIKPTAQREQGPKPVRKRGPAKSSHAVEPYDSSTVHAQFNPSQQRGLARTHLEDCDESAVEPAGDEYEYLLQEADMQRADDDTDSCVTFDDTASDTEQFGMSPTAESTFEPPFLPRLKAKASEVPVYSGPELWFEDEDFIE